MKRFLVVLAVLVALIGAVAAHIWFWYAPRPRPARPKPDSPVAGLLGNDRFTAVLWLPYPHQNLGSLDPAAPAHQDYLAAFARLSGLPPPVLPSFGGFPVVPASELAVAADADGDRFVVMAQVYPLLAMFSRLAGRLADNAWLAGGPVIVEGRSAEVRWEGNVWIVHHVGAPEVAGSVPPAAADAPALGVLALHRSADPFPADIYRLESDAERILLRTAADLPQTLWQKAAAVRSSEMILLTLAGPGSPNGVQALAFFRRKQHSSDLPRAATLERLASPPADAWGVPGGALARLAGALRRGEAAGFEVEAIGDAGLSFALELAPLAAAVASSTASEGGPGGTLAWGLWADMRNTRAEVSRLAELTARLPLVPRHQARRFRDAQTVLAPLAERFGRLVVVVSSDPAALRLELQRQGASAPLAGPKSD